MQITDPIADLLTRVRNANNAKHETVEVPASKMKMAICQILLEEGYVKDVQTVEDGVQGKIVITLKYGAGKTRNDKNDRQNADSFLLHGHDLLYCWISQRIFLTSYHSFLRFSMYFLDSGHKNQNKQIKPDGFCERKLSGYQADLLL